MKPITIHIERFHHKYNLREQRETKAILDDEPNVRNGGVIQKEDLSAIMRERLYHRPHLECTREETKSANQPG
jgi:hypothetical protein